MTKSELLQEIKKLDMKIHEIFFNKWSLEINLYEMQSERLKLKNKLTGSKKWF